jgi:hypothetical protein
MSGRIACTQDRLPQPKLGAPPPARLRISTVNLRLAGPRSRGAGSRARRAPAGDSRGTVSPHLPGPRGGPGDNVQRPASPRRASRPPLPASVNFHRGPGDDVTLTTPAALHIRLVQTFRALSRCRSNPVSSDLQVNDCVHHQVLVIPLDCANPGAPAAPRCAWRTAPATCLTGGG